MTSSAALVLGGGELEAVILPELGGRIHRIRAFGEDLLRTPVDPAAHASEPFLWGAYVMAPWCNRAAPGPMELAGRRVNLAPNFPDGTAIHGLVSSALWVRQPGGELAIRRDADHAWPWAFEVRQRASLAGSTLELAYVLVNLDDAPMPAGIGLHPWFRRPLRLRLPAERAYASNSDSPPEPAPVGGDLDLRTGAPPPDGLDGTWSGLAEERVELTWPASGMRLALAIETDAPSALVAVATPAGINAIAVEPQTHGPDPFRRLATGEPDPPMLLPPGASVRLTIRLTPERIGAAA
jgi:aldose 1-epimerase